MSVVNHAPGCQHPTACHALGTGLCRACARHAPRLPNVVRIELTAAHRRRLGNMASEAGITADELASRLLSDLIDEDAKAHGASA